MGRERVASQPTKKPCKVCGRASLPGYSRCGACYKYYRIHQVERPPRLYTRKLPSDRKGKPGWCEVCGDVNVKAAGKCWTCYIYFRKHGRNRPRWWWDKDAKCKTCGFPLEALGRSPSGKTRHVKGRCMTCYHYLERTGKERPRELWGIGPVGWCECGYPAVALVEDIPVCVRHQE